MENLTKQLNQQNSNVNTLNKLLENQQILSLESNKKIQKLESQLEEERLLNYSFDTTSNNRQNINFHKKQLLLKNLKISINNKQSVNQQKKK